MGIGIISGFAFLLQHFRDLQEVLRHFRIERSSTHSDRQRSPSHRLSSVNRAGLPILCIQPDTPPTVLHVLLDDAFLQPEATLQKSASNRLVRARASGKARIDHHVLTLVDLVHCAVFILS
ncbi:MAG: hypothetical protein IPN98_15915 [Propionivibrio sp.]|nr:hypothetical protein [Propionivibrio sp.]